MKTMGLVRCLSRALLATALLGCSVESEDTDTGGIELKGTPGERGFVVVNTDYQSSSVSLVSAGGEVLSASFVSSSSAKPGLSTAFSGDVVPPSMPLSSDELVLVDRFPASVLTWIDLRTSKVRAQLNVSTGFSANPHDYVPISETKAYVPRFEPNHASGQAKFDGGDDLLVIDPSIPEVTGRVDLGPALDGEESGFFARADRALLAGGRLRVLLVGYNADYTESLDARVVSVDAETDAITQVLVLDGLHSCTNLVLSPDEQQLAVACNGAFGQDPAEGFPDSAIVTLSVGDDLAEVERFAAADLGGEQISSVAYADARTLLYTTYGRFSEDGSEMAAPDTLRRLDLSTSRGGTQPLVRSAEIPFSIGEVRCIPAEQVCLVADAETDGGVVRRYRVAADGQIEGQGTVVLDAQLGLPPRYVGVF